MPVPHPVLNGRRSHGDGRQGMDMLTRVWPLLLAYLLAIPIGWDRERFARSAGLRTFPLVAMACCGFILAADHLGADNAARFAQGIIGGIGFIGAGAILRRGD